MALERQVAGRDPADPEAIRQALWGDLRYQMGTKGVGVSAASALEWATWDLLGKQTGESVSRMLGRKREHVPCSAGGSLWFGASVDELCEGASAVVDDGHRMMKMRARLHGVDEDVRRVTAVRETIGTDLELAVDCLQLFSFDEALDFGRRVEDLGLTWIEDPLDVRHVDGHARLAAELDTPIATGEHEYGVHGFRSLLDAEAADVLLIDLARVGGVADFVDVAELATQRGVKAVNHCAPEQSVQLAAVAPVHIEHVDWWSALYEEQLAIVNGEAVVPDEPGFGFTFVPEVAERFAVV